MLSTSKGRRRAREALAAAPKPAPTPTSPARLLRIHLFAGVPHRGQERPAQRRRAATVVLECAVVHPRQPLHAAAGPEVCDERVQRALALLARGRGEGLEEREEAAGVARRRGGEVGVGDSNGGGRRRRRRRGGCGGGIGGVGCGRRRQRRGDWAQAVVLAGVGDAGLHKLDGRVARVRARRQNLRAASRTRAANNGSKELQDVAATALPFRRVKASRCTHACISMRWAGARLRLLLLEAEGGAVDRVAGLEGGLLGRADGAQGRV